MPADSDAPPIVAAAQAGPAPSRGLLLSLEADFQKAVSSPQNNQFGPGFTVGFSVEYQLKPWLLVGGRVRGGFLFDAPAPTNPGSGDPGWGYQVMIMPTARFRPLASGDSVERGTGFFADVGVGGGVANGHGVAALDFGVGYMFRLGDQDAGPVFRYMHLVSGGNDTSLIVFGALVSFGDVRDEAPVEAPEVTWRPETRARDTDGDGLVGSADSCPREAEDEDGFHDEDGCPDFDNDDDGVLDRDDACANEAEDTDGFEDTDGCPDADNDADGVFDDADECPDTSEVINGVSDEDGCPDEGVIALREGRVLIEDRLLFSGNQSRLARGAARVVTALAVISSQHPEWVSIRIESHIEARGNTARNQRLTEQRAQALRTALIAQGVPEARVTAEGVGATRPREGTASTSSRRHRRVEVIITTPGARAE